MQFDVIGDPASVLVPSTGAAGVAFPNPTATRAGVLIYNDSEAEIFVSFRRWGSAPPSAAQVIETLSCRIPAGSMLPIGARGRTVVYLAIASGTGAATVQEID